MFDIFHLIKTTRRHQIFPDHVFCKGTKCTVAVVMPKIKLPDRAHDGVHPNSDLPWTGCYPKKFPICPIIYGYV